MENKEKDDELIENKSFFKKNARLIGEVFVGSVLVGGLGYYGYKCKLLSTTVEHQQKTINRLVEKNIALKNSNDYFKKLCGIKDMRFKEVISDGLRHGSSLAAHHMAQIRSSNYVN